MSETPVDDEELRTIVNGIWRRLSDEAEDLSRRLPQSAEQSAIKESVRRFALVFFVTALSISASGVIELVIPEACSIEEANSSQDQDCSATCFRCHCGRSIEIAVYSLVAGHVPLVAEAIRPTSFLPTGSPSEILHVPKL